VEWDFPGITRSESWNEQWDNRVRLQGCTCEIFLEVTRSEGWDKHAVRIWSEIFQKITSWRVEMSSARQWSEIFLEECSFLLCIILLSDEQEYLNLHFLRKNFCSILVGAEAQICLACDERNLTHNSFQCSAYFPYINCHSFYCLFSWYKMSQYTIIPWVFGWQSKLLSQGIGDDQGNCCLRPVGRGQQFPWSSPITRDNNLGLLPKIPMG
jgi:hypothetical protein